MRDRLSFPGVFYPVSGIEKPALNRDKGVVIITVTDQFQSKQITQLTYDFKNPFPCPYTMGIADSSAMLTWSGCILTNLPYFACASFTLW